MMRPFPLTTVGGLLRDRDGNVLIVRTRKWSNLWGIPGGKVEYGETLEDGFRRETLEETGLELENPRMVMVQEAIDHPEFHQKKHFILFNYVADVVSDHACPEVTLNDEAEEYRWVRLPESFNLPLNGPTRALLEKINADLRKGESVWARSAFEN
jgi:ADP-ribose pyrophosphatase YjhB (NUDIX family)